MAEEPPPEGDFIRATLDVDGQERLVFTCAGDDADNKVFHTTFHNFSARCRVPVDGSPIGHFADLQVSAPPDQDFSTFELPLMTWAWAVGEPMNNTPGKPTVNARIQRLTSTLPEDALSQVDPFMDGELELTAVSYAEPYRLAGTIRFNRVEGVHVNGVTFPAATGSIEFDVTLASGP